MSCAADTGVVVAAWFFSSVCVVSCRTAQLLPFDKSAQPLRSLYNPSPRLHVRCKAGWPSFCAVPPLPRTRISYRLTRSVRLLVWFGRCTVQSVFCSARGHLFFRAVQHPSSNSVTRWLPPTRSPHPADARGHGPCKLRRVCHPLCCASACHSSARGLLPLCWGSPCTVVVMPITASACKHVCADMAWFGATSGPVWPGPEEWHSRQDRQ